MPRKRSDGLHEGRTVRCRAGVAVRQITAEDGVTTGTVSLHAVSIPSAGPSEGRGATVEVRIAAIRTAVPTHLLHGALPDTRRYRDTRRRTCLGGDPE